jgi:hypothetical protein
MKKLRVINSGESHQVRVHKMFFMRMAPSLRVGTDSARSFESTQLQGSRKIISHGKDENTKAHLSQSTEFLAGGEIMGELEGS